MGIHYLKDDMYEYAKQFLEEAKRLCETDPLVANELGTVYFKLGW